VYEALSYVFMRPEATTVCVCVCVCVRACKSLANLLVANSLSDPHAQALAQKNKK
jgi:hypothetical protein